MNTRYNILGNQLNVIIMTLLLAVVASCGGDDAADTDGGGGQIDAGPTDSPPIFAGVLFTYSHEAGAVTALWGEAQDDVSAASTIEYRLYVGPSEDPAVLGKPENLAATIIGETSGVVTGLSSDAVVYVAVIALDEAGHQSPMHAPMPVKPLAGNIDLSTIPKDATDLGLVVTPMRPDGSGGYDQFLVSGTAASNIALNDVLAIDHQGHTLKEVTSIEASGSDFLVTTRDASLIDITRDASLDMASRIPPISEVGGGMPTMVERLDDSGGVVMVPAHQFIDPTGHGDRKVGSGHRQGFGVGLSS